jgi:hypothetical protein
MYKLLVYLKLDDQLHEIYSIFGDGEDDLIAIGKEHKSNNPDYVVLVVTYSVASVKVVESEETSE